MRTLRQVLSVFALSLAVLLLGATPLLAKCAHLKLKVTPKEAYVFVDGIPVGPGSGVIWADPGEHTLAAYNYGYKPYSAKFTAESGKTTTLAVTLEQISGTSPGPWGRIELRGKETGGAVLLNGTTPDYLVGDVSETKGGKRRLLVPPGDYQLTVLGCCSGTLYSGPITVGEGQATVIPLANPGGKTTADFSAGKSLGALPRFQASGAAVTIAVAKPTAQMSAASSTVDCGASTQINWSTSDAPKVEISGMGAVAASGQQSVQPTQTTDYKLTATGPGGIVSNDTTVNVNSTIQGSLSVEPAQVTFHKIGDKVEEQGSATLTWNAPSASTATLDPLGSVSPSGTRTVQPTPTKTEVGPVDETVTYTLHASNACGGSDTKTASLHIVGNIESGREAQAEILAAKLPGNSVYFATNLPNKRNPEGGLESSQEQVLQQLADVFKQYNSLLPDAHLVLEGRADRRGSANWNMDLSQRRADRVKSYLVSQGVSGGSIETKAFGKSEQMDSATVKQLLGQIPNLTDQDRKKVLRRLPTFVLANNRRVDIVLGTTGKRSTQYYPYSAPDLKKLLR
jgi:outer membrane protein OmpA-like peptidoglycan-associated protein/plastocyanin